MDCLLRGNPQVPEQIIIVIKYFQIYLTQSSPPTIAGENLAGDGGNPLESPKLEADMVVD